MINYDTTPFTTEAFLYRKRSSFLPSFYYCPNFNVVTNGFRSETGDISFRSSHLELDGNPSEDTYVKGMFSLRFNSEINDYLVPFYNEIYLELSEVSPGVDVSSDIINKYMIEQKFCINISDYNLAIGQTYTIIFNNMFVGVSINNDEYKYKYKVFTVENQYIKLNYCHYVDLNNDWFIPNITVGSASTLSDLINETKGFLFFQIYNGDIDDLSTEDKENLLSLSNEFSYSFKHKNYNKLNEVIDSVGNDDYGISTSISYNNVSINNYGNNFLLTSIFNNIPDNENLVFNNNNFSINSYDEMFDKIVSDNFDNTGELDELTTLRTGFFGNPVGSDGKRFHFNVEENNQLFLPKTNIRGAVDQNYGFFLNYFYKLLFTLTPPTFVVAERYSKYNLGMIPLTIIPENIEDYPEGFFSHELNVPLIIKLFMIVIKSNYNPISEGEYPEYPDYPVFSLPMPLDCIETRKNFDSLEFEYENINVGEEAGYSSQGRDSVSLEYYRSYSRTVKTKIALARAKFKLSLNNHIYEDLSELNEPFYTNDSVIYNKFGDIVIFYNDFSEESYNYLPNIVLGAPLNLESYATYSELYRINFAFFPQPYYKGQ